MKEWRYETLRKVLNSGLTVEQSHEKHWDHLLNTEGAPIVKKLQKVWDAPRNRSLRRAEKLGALLALSLSWEERRHMSQDIELRDYLLRESNLGALDTFQDQQDEEQFYQKVMDYHDNFVWMLKEMKLSKSELRFLFQL